MRKSSSALTLHHHRLRHGHPQAEAVATAAFTQDAGRDRWPRPPELGNSGSASRSTATFYRQRARHKTLLLFKRNRCLFFPGRRVRSVCLTASLLLPISLFAYSETAAPRFAGELMQRMMGRLDLAFPVAFLWVQKRQSSPVPNFPLLQIC